MEKKDIAMVASDLSGMPTDFIDGTTAPELTELPGKTIYPAVLTTLPFPGMD